MRAWLLLVHQLPARPSNLRVRTWRRLQQVGALAVKHAVYALPDSPAAREDFEWLKTEIEGAGGTASIFVADAVDTWSHDALVEEFRRTREASYTAVAQDAERALRRLESGRRGASPSPRDIDRLRERLSAIERVDFFGSAGRDRVLGLVRRIEEAARGRAARGPAVASAEPPSSYSERLWVTRPRPGVDRMASAWLIARFIDPAARFDFVTDRNAAPSTAVPFDMFGVEFTHRGELCTFELLRESFQLSDPALPRLAAIVHDLDLKDGRFGATEAPAIGSVIDGLQLAHPDDHALLAAGMALFEALYLRFAQAERTSGPRPLAKRSAKPRSRPSRPRSR
jgi:hypothetical protein